MKTQPILLTKKEALRLLSKYVKDEIDNVKRFTQDEQEIWIDDVKTEIKSGLVDYYQISRFVDVSEDEKIGWKEIFKRLSDVDKTISYSIRKPLNEMARKFHTQAPVGHFIIYILNKHRK